MTPGRGERFDRGAQQLRAMGGDIQDIVNSLDPVAPDMATLVGEFAFGDLYTRPGLGLRDRQIATIAALVSLGHTEPQLRFHIKAAINCGVEKHEVVEVIIHMLAFAGNPRAFNAMMVAKDAFSELEVSSAMP